MANSTSRDCAVIISTCDNYSDIWDPFFTLFHKFWTDNPYPVFVNSETFDCHNDNVAVTTLKARAATLSWTRRLKEALERVNTEYIIFILDDFFFCDNVDTTRIEECIEHMRKDSDIAAVYFSSLGYQMEDCPLPELEKCRHTGKSKVNLTLALWRKDVFLYYLNHDETAWEFEANSLERSLGRRDTFYSFSRSARIVIPYDYVKYGLFAGKWFKPTTDLFKEHGIAHDFSARGFYEEYEYGLIPYVARQIKMDSYLVPCYSLTRDNPRIDVDKVINERRFSQTYDIPGSKNAAIWYPSSIPGYAIEDFKCTITFKSKKTETLEAGDVFGSFSLYRNAMYFLKWGVCVYILPQSKHEMSSITIEGCMTKNLSREDLVAAYDMDIRVVPTSLGGLLNSSRIYAETLLIPENFISFRIYSRLCFKYNNNFDEKRAISDEKDRFPGQFSQVYKIDKSADNTVKWDIGGSFGGYAIEDLRVEIICSSGNTQPIESRNIKGDGLLIDGYWVFLSPTAHLLFSLPEESSDEIRISGNVLAPMPRRILRTAIYADAADDEVNDYGEAVKNKNSDSLLNPNGLRFILSLVKRAIRKYGIFGVVKEAVKRLFRG